MKRIIALILSLIISITFLLPLNTLGYVYPDNYKWEYSHQKGSGIYFNVNIDNIYYDIYIYDRVVALSTGGKGTYAVSMKFAKTKGSTLKIPATINFQGKSLKIQEINIGDDCAYAPYGIWNMPYKTIIIPDTVKEADFSYAKFTKLEKIYVPKSTRVLNGLSDYPKLKVIIDKKNPYIKMKNGALYSKDGKRLIELVNSKKKYTVSKGTKDIRFYNVKKLEKVYLPASLEKISNDAFRKCSNLKKVSISNKTKKIGFAAFEKCASLKKIVLPKNLEVIDISAFADCTSLKKIEIPNKVRKIDTGTFKNCDSLKKMVIPNNVEKIGSSAFEDCDLLSNIVLSENIKKINYKTFKNCISLKKISIPKNVKKIENMAFKDCNELSTVIIESDEKAPKIINISFTAKGSNAFKNTKYGIQFIVKNQTVADQLKEQLNGSGVKNAKILIGENVVYENING